MASGAEIIVVPTCWTRDESCAYGVALNADYESLVLNSLVTARCFENVCAVVLCNAGGPEEVFVGMSQVAVPFVGRLGGIEGAGEGMVVVEIDKEVLVEAERNYQVRADMASEGWHYRYR